MLFTRIATAICASLILIVGGIASIGMLSGGAAGSGIFVLVAVALLCGLCGLLATLPWKGGEQARAAAAISSSLYFVLCLIVLIVNFCMAVASPERDAGEKNSTSLGMVVISTFLLTYVALLTRLRRLVPGNENKRSKAALVWYIATMIIFVGMGGVNSFFVLRESIRRTLITNQPPQQPGNHPEALIQIPEFNYQVKSPGGKWTRAEKGAFSKDASLVLANSQDDQYFIVICEDIGENSRFDLDSYIATIKTKVSAGLESFETGPLEPLEIAGVSGLLMPAKARVNRSELQYYYWFTIHNGVAYQLIGAGALTRASAVESSTRDLFARFSFIDPNWSLNSARSSRSTRQLAPEYGLTLDLENSGCYPQPTSGAEGQMARFAAQNGNALALEVTPVDLGDTNLPDDVIAHGLLRTIEFSYPGEQIVRTDDSVSGEVRTTRFSAEREVDGVRYAYRCRILRRGPIACLAVAWQLASNPDRNALESILDRVSLGEVGPATKPQSAAKRDAKFWNNAGLSLFGSEQYDAADGCFRRAAEADPKDPVYVQNAAQAMREQKKFAEAASYMKDRLGPFPSEVTLARYADSLEQAGDSAGAIDAYGRMLEIPAARQKALNARVALFIAAKRFDDADSDLEKYKSLGPNRTLHAKVLRARDRIDDAAAILRAGLDAEPIDTAAGEDFIDLASELDRHTDVIEASERLSKSGYRTAYTLYHKGLAEFSLDRLPAARQSLEEAQRLVPSDTTVKELLQRVQTRLGQGDATLFKDPIEAVPMPAQALEGATPFETDAGVIFRHRVSCFRFVPGSDFLQTIYYRFTLADRRSIDEVSTFSFDFDPEFERLFVNKVEVRDEKGELVSTGDVSNYFVSSDSQSGMASQTQTLHVPINALAPGRTVDLVVTRRDLSQPKTIPFKRWFLGSHSALERSAATLEAPEGEFDFHAENGARVVRFPGGVAFLFDHQRAWEPEPWGAAASTFVPYVVFGDHRESWPALGREYLTMIAERLEIPQSVRDLAASLVPKDADQRGTVRAIASYVQKEYGYRAIEFGPRAQIPSPVTQIVANRFGDCKDHSLLFVQLLESVGIEAHLALAATDFPIVDELPSRLQFNHMIAFIPSMDLFVDLTDKNIDPLQQPPYGLNGRQVLVLDPAAPLLKRIGEYADPAAILDTQREIEASGRDLIVNETLTLSGLAAGWMRELAQSPKTRLVEEFAPFYSPAGAQILEVEPIDPHDTSKSLVIRLKYTVPGALLDVGGHTTVTLPYVFDRRWYVLRHVAQRQTPMEISFTSTSRSKTTLKLGPGIKIIRPDTPEWQRDLPSAFAERKVSVRGDDIVIEATVTLKQGTFSAEEYNACAALTTEAVTAFERDVVVTRGAKSE